MRSLLALLFFTLIQTVAWAIGYQVFEENGKVGIKSESGEVILPAAFEALGWSDGSFSVIGQVTGYRSKDQWGLLNLKKEFITKAEYGQLIHTGGDRIIVSKKINPFSVKLGCINLEGKLTIPLRYDGIRINGLRAIVFVKNGSKYEYGLIDLFDRGILPLKYKSIESLGSLRYAVQNFDNKIALHTDEGVKLTDFVIDSLSAFNKGWFVIHQNFRQGLLTREGEIKIEPIYRELKINNNCTVSARAFNAWKTVDAKNVEQELLEADTLFPDGKNYRFIKSGKMGLLDETFKIKIQPRYDHLDPFVLGKAAAKRENKYGVIRIDNTVIMPFLFDSLIVDGRLIRVKNKTAGTVSWSLFDTVGVQKSQNYYDAIDPYNGRFFPVSNRGYFGGMDKYGKEIIHCVYDSILNAREDRVAIKFKGQYGIISLEENWMLTPQPHPVSIVNNDLYLEKQPTVTFLKTLQGETVYFTANPIQLQDSLLIEQLPDRTNQYIDFKGRVVEVAATAAPPIVEVQDIFPESEGLRGIKRDGKYGFVDAKGRLLVANRYEDIGRFKEGLAAIRILGKWGFVNATDQIVINPAYEEVKEFTNGVAIVKRSGKWGLVDREGKTTLAIRYDQIQKVNTKFLITVNQLKGLADEKGNVIIEPRFDHLQIVDNEQVLVGVAGKWGVLSYTGMNIVPMHYDQLIFLAEKKSYLALKRSEWKNLRLE
jgi:WG containing repeat